MRLENEKNTFYCQNKRGSKLNVIQQNFPYSYFLFLLHCLFKVQDQNLNFEVQIFFSHEQKYWPRFGSICEQVMIAHL